MQALIVEDDVNLARALAHMLKREGYSVDVVHNGEEGLNYGLNRRYDVMVFDVMLPRMDGMRAVEALRKSGVSSPVLMLTAKDGIPDKIAGLDSGADSYMTKPFSSEELKARLRALTRRVMEDPVCALEFGDLVLDPKTRKLTCGDESIMLVNKEYLLAERLLEAAGSVVSKALIADAVWGETVSDNSIEAYVSMLRKKLRFLGSDVQIKLMRKVGYRLVAKENDR